VSSVDSTADLSTDDEDPIVRALARELPGRLGDALATLVVLVTLALLVWSLIVTWMGLSQYGPSLFNVVVVGTVVGGVALYARTTFSYVIALLAAAAWLIVSAVPFVPIVQLILQTLTVTLMLYGVVVAICAVGYNKRRYSFTR
jgi:hypothetical protein